jgi:hypothetical protein
LPEAIQNNAWSPCAMSRQAQAPTDGSVGVIPQILRAASLWR